MSKRRGGMGGRPGGAPNQSAMLRQIQKMQEDMEAAQAALETETIDVSVGGGAVTIVMTGSQKVQSITVNPDGSRVFDYPRQPEGWTNYVITIGADGNMSSLRQLLTEDNFARVRPGMDKLEVRRLLGPTAQTKRYDLKNEEVWDWRFKQHGQDSRFFSVTFGADGHVLGSAIGDDPREIVGGGK